MDWFCHIVFFYLFVCLWFSVSGHILSQVNGHGLLWNIAVIGCIVSSWWYAWNHFLPVQKRKKNSDENHIMFVDAVCCRDLNQTRIFEWTAISSWNMAQVECVQNTCSLFWLSFFVVVEDETRFRIDFPMW